LVLLCRHRCVGSGDVSSLPRSDRIQTPSISFILRTRVLSIIRDEWSRCRIHLPLRSAWIIADRTISAS
jgi:hypothetical protein